MRRWLRALSSPPFRRRATRAALVVFLLPLALLLLAAALTPLPPELAEEAPKDSSIEIVDREGFVLREVRASDATRARWVSLDAIGERPQRALIAAEDRRFAMHPGIDPLAILRAVGQLVVSGHVVSGASTLTQQLARNLVPTDRTVMGKLAEMARAIRIEASLSKRAILEQYLNRVAFGPGLRGIEAASRFYFDKPSGDLSLAEAAALASMPRGPSLYDPMKGTEKLKARRDRVLDRMQDGDLASAEEVTRAKAEPLVVRGGGSGFGAPHLVVALLAGTIDTGAGALAGKTSRIATTLDRALQRELTVLAKSAVRRLADKHVTAASIVAIDNATGDLLAYVGSPDIDDAERLGHNDGVLAKRQPGSSLKPFVYELAMEELDFTAATLLPDIDTHFPTSEGDYHPHNYDGRFHGPVLLREALASSLNVPAVWTASRLGVDRVLDRLRDLGLPLDRSAEDYGVAIALGDGEVRLLDLASAYVTLARGGVSAPVRAVREALDPAGSRIALERPSSSRVMREAEALVIADVLSDEGARVASFGRDSVLEFPFAVAAKTGTSKGFRDNLAVGFSAQVTVAVWVGNFDGSPMQGVSGISGAGPLFHDAMIAAMRARGAGESEAPAFDPFAPRESDFEVAEVCTLSGAIPTSACSHTRRERFVAGREATPTARCAMHERVRIDRRTSLRAGSRCPESEVEERVFERFVAPFSDWARSAGRSLSPAAYSPLCPATDEDEARDVAPPASLRIAYPPSGARFTRDPGLASPQAIRVRIEAPPSVTAVRVRVGDQVFFARQAPFFIDFPLVAGEHRLRAEADGARASDAIAIFVD